MTPRVFLFRATLAAAFAIGLALAGPPASAAPSAPSPAAPYPLLSKSATASLLTLWPGNEIYIAFGHSALRIRDPERGIDLVFNYGTFDLTDPLFVPKFVKGYLDYYLAYYPFAEDFEYDKRTENRIWYEQILDLDRSETSALFAFLMDNARPEKRYYRYDFILDNCATRIRDALVSVLGSKLRYDPRNERAPRKSYRIMIDEFVRDWPFYRFMFYPVLGLASDREASSYGSQFLPLYMMRVFESSAILRDGKEVPLVRSAAELYRPIREPQRGAPWADPSYLIWPCAAAALFFTARDALKRRRREATPAVRRGRRPFDALLFLVTGLMGCIVFYLSFLSVHAATKENLNVLWLLPTNLVAAWFLARERPRPRWLRWYLAVAAASCALPLLGWPLWPQRMHPTMAPLMAMIAARSLWLCLAGEKKEKAPESGASTGAG